jgi:hypothetical protein
MSDMSIILMLSDLEKEGLIKRFEFTLELAWKVLKDKMQDDGGACSRAFGFLTDKSKVS